MRERPMLLGVLLSSALLWACGGSSPSPDASVDAGTRSDGGTDGGWQPSPAQVAAWNQYLAWAGSQLPASGTPGASIAVVLDGHVAFAAGVGKKRYDASDPVTTSTRFRAASMSKMILAATAMTLVDEGKLDLSLPITHYLPWFTLQTPFDPSSITTSELLSHNAGFPCDTIPQCDTTSSGPRQTYFAANPQPLWAPPGQIYDYSNSGFALASLVLTSAAGVTDDGFEQLVAQRIFTPVGMTTATYDAVATTAGDHALGHELNSNGTLSFTTEPSDFACPLLDPPGGIAATASDYAAFAAMLIARGDGILSPASVAAMEAPHVSMNTFATQEYGYALISQGYPYGAHSLVWHNGSLPGYLSEMLMVPDFGFAVVVLTNGRGAQDMSDAMAVQALNAFLPETQTWPCPGACATPPSDWAAYAGTYIDPYGQLGAVTVSLATDGGVTSLAVNAPDASYFGTPAPILGPAAQFATDTWTLPDGTGATFFRTDAGVVEWLVTRRGVALRQ
jgi:CubicO group peptidase (beta-lactamase class C family)